RLWVGDTGMPSPLWMGAVVPGRGYRRSVPMNATRGESAMNTTNTGVSADMGTSPTERSTSVETTGSNKGIRLKVATYINAHKILVHPVVLGLMWLYDNWSAEAYIYLAIHGTYSILWLLKHAMYADRRFDEKKPLWFGVPFIFVPLAGYYAAPYLL